ncbi:MAG: hypothetical protein WCW14_02440 [Candidatus Paceibacterota bacterium]|jgi:hypothetical protein
MSESDPNLIVEQTSSKDNLELARKRYEIAKEALGIEGAKKFGDLLMENDPKAIEFYEALTALRIVEFRGDHQ